MGGGALPQRPTVSFSIFWASRARGSSSSDSRRWMPGREQSCCRQRPPGRSVAPPPPPARPPQPSTLSPPGSLSGTGRPTRFFVEGASPPWRWKGMGAGPWGGGRTDSRCRIFSWWPLKWDEGLLSAQPGCSPSPGPGPALPTSPSPVALLQGLRPHLLSQPAVGQRALNVLVHQLCLGGAGVSGWLWDLGTRAHSTAARLTSTWSQWKKWTSGLLWSESWHTSSSTDG